MAEVTLHDDVAYWLDEIQACRDREADFRKDGQRICDIYEANKTEATPFNILFSNTETLAPALYSATPRPVVERRFKDDDPLGKAAAQASRRILEFQLDTNLDGYDTFDGAMKEANLNALLPGRAYTFVKYDAEIEEAPTTDKPDETEPVKKHSELVCPDSKSWNRIFQGYATKWANVPWIAEELYVDKKEAMRLFGKELAEKLRYSEGEATEKEAEKGPEQKDARHQGRRKTVQVYQIWDKDGGKKVRYIAPSYPEGELLVKDDPLKLTGFFPCPEPLAYLDKVNSLTPTALYTLYETQAKELNRLTVRISYLVEAIKAKGAYAGSHSDTLSKIVSAGDNELVAAENASDMAFEKGFAASVWMWPVEQLIIVLEKLYQAREMCKQVIYEITGISDIIRGASKASETLGAQKIKTQWGTLRLKNKQKEVARYARDLLRMMLELSANNFSQETWAKMTGLPFLADATVNELTAVQQAIQQQLMAQPPQPPVDPAQPAPPNPLLLQLQQVQQHLQAPKWADVLALLQNDLQRAYRVDIETNSTVEPEAAEDKEAIVDLLTVIGQFLQGVTPLIVSGSLPFEAAQGMLLFIARRFRFGSEIEDYIKNMKAPAPEGDGGAAAEQKAQAEKMQMQHQMAQKDLQHQQESGQNDLKLKGMQQDQQHAQRSTDQDVRELKIQHANELLQVHQKAAQESLSQRDAVSTHKLNTEKKVASLENQKYKTENVVNQKADQTLGKGLTAMQDMVKTLVQTVDKQSKDSHAMVTELTKAITAPRVKKAVRDKQGRLESVEEKVA